MGQQQQQQQQYNSTAGRVSPVQQQYPAVNSGSSPWLTANSTATGWETQSIASNATYPRIQSDYARSEASVSVASAPAGSECSDDCASGVTELMRCSVNFRGELQQLLSMLKTAEQEAQQGIGFLERQIEQVAKVSVCRSGEIVRIVVEVLLC
jgi:hypothetical protein